MPTARARLPRGRPCKLNVECFLRICGWIQQGLTNTEACEAEDIDYGGFRVRVRQKPSWAKRLHQAGQIRDRRDSRLTRRPVRLAPGMAVVHQKHGVGTIIAEWPTLRVYSSGALLYVSGKGIYDVEFGVKPHRIMHCCRAEYLQKLQ